MKKINWQFVTIVCSIIGSLAYGSMRFGRLEQKVEGEVEWRCIQQETNKEIIVTIKELTNEVKSLKKVITDTRHEIELNRIRSGD